MKTSTFISEEQLVSSAIDTLIKKLGPVETNRFLSLMKSNRVDSVRRHQLWQKKLDKEAFFTAAFR
jgi:hypothetical protein